MNSADKIEDTSGTGQLLGMEKTIRDTGGNNWLASEAFPNPLIPLDNEMGTGQLNAKRAVQQFQPGEFDSDTGLNSVEPIGWDYGHTGFDGDFNRYLINTPLVGGDYISITLAWDRLVEFDTDAGTSGAYDFGDTFQDFTSADADDVINDLDLYLVPLDTFVQEVESASFVGTEEHIFAQVPFDGEFEIWVIQQDDDVPGGQDYGLAWWYGAAPPPAIAGDFDGDSDVDGIDFLAWQRGESPDPLSASDLADWEANYGTDTSLTATSTTVPEPNTSILLMVLVGSLTACRLRNR